jgi:hypothetical protein
MNTLDGDDGAPRRSALWSRDDAWPTARQRTAVHHAVRQVLDALAPEPVPSRGAVPRPDVHRYRSPSGCILQGAGTAVSVSWFTADGEGTHGELHVTAWAGVVSRPGATRRATGGARAVATELLRPIETPADTWSWRAADGSVLDTGAVVARCLALLAGDSPAPPLPELP